MRWIQGWVCAAALACGASAVFAQAASAPEGEAERAKAAVAKLVAGESRGWSIVRTMHDIHPRAGLPAVLEALHQMPDEVLSEVQTLLIGWTGRRKDVPYTFERTPSAMAAAWREWWKTNGPTFKFPRELMPEWNRELTAEAARLMAAEPDVAMVDKLRVFLDDADSGRFDRDVPPLSQVPRHRAAVAALIAVLCRGKVPGGVVDRLNELTEQRWTTRPTMSTSPWLVAPHWYEWWRTQGKHFDVFRPKEDYWAVSQQFVREALAAEPDAAIRARLQAALDGLLTHGARYRLDQSIAESRSAAVPPLLLLAFATDGAGAHHARGWAHGQLQRLSRRRVTWDQRGGIRSHARALAEWVAWWREAKATYAASLPPAAPKVPPQELETKVLELLKRIFDEEAQHGGGLPPVDLVRLRYPNAPILSRLVAPLDGEAQGWGGGRQQAVGRWDGEVLALGAGAVTIVIRELRRRRQVSWAGAQLLAQAYQRGLAPELPRDLGKETAPSFRLMAATALLAAGESSAVPAFVEMAGESRFDVRLHAVWVLAVGGDRRAVPPLRTALQDRNLYVAQVAIAGLALHGDQESAPALDLVFRGHPSQPVREAALEALIALRSGLAEPYLRAMLERLGWSRAEAAEQRRTLEKLDELTGSGIWSKHWAPVEQAQQAARERELARQGRRRGDPPPDEAPAVNWWERTVAAMRGARAEYAARWKAREEREKK